MTLSKVNMPRRCSSRVLSNATNRDLFPLPVSARRPHTSNTANVNGTKKRCHKIKISNLYKISTCLQSCSRLALLNATNGHLFPLPVSATRPQTSNTANINGGNSTLFILWHRFFVPLTLAVFDLWSRLAETGSRNKWPLVAFKSNLETC